MLPASPVKHPKRRQTCDPCRKAKIKCDKRTPICGRCLATGDLCDYGISRQGAWWRHKGRGRSIQLSKDELAEAPSALYLPPTYSETASSISPASSTNIHDQDAIYDSELGFNCLPGELLFSHLCSAQFTPPNSMEPHDNKNFATGLQSPTAYGNQHWSTTSITSQFTFPNGHKIQENGSLNDTSTVSSIATGETISPRSSTDFHQCACFGLTLRALQTLEDCFLRTNDRNLRSTAAESATILETNERNIDCCWTALRCKSCSNDYNKSPTLLLYTLIKKELLVLEPWVFACPTQPTSDPTDSHLVNSTQDRYLKIGAAQIVARRLKEILNELGQACQTISCDYTRLAHAFLIENLLLQLESVCERLNMEINGPCLAVIRSIESIGIGLEGLEGPRNH